MFKLFLSAMVQVTLVAMNVVFISNNQILMMLITSFGLSLAWAYNVKSEILNTTIGKFIYATGACTGTGTGYIIAKQLILVI